MNAPRFAVVYLWQGERHRLLPDFDSKDAAMLHVTELQSRGFRAWVEGL